VTGLSGSLILITVDCLRADHVGFLGYKRPTTPFLDSLANQSFVFSQAVANGTPTYYSLPAILASRYPLALGRDLIGLAPDESTITTVFKEYGYQTAAFVAANPYLSPRFGYDAGFDVFRDYLDPESIEFHAAPSAQLNSGARNRANEVLSKACHLSPVLGRAYNELYFQYCQRSARNGVSSLDSLRRFPAADVIVDDAIAWLNQNIRRPFFLWLHFMDPHSPYYPKQHALNEMGDGQIDAAQARYLNSFWAREDLPVKRLAAKRDRVTALYDAGIRWVDDQIRRLSERLLELNLWDQTSLAVTADHGEEFLDHGGRFHAPVKLTAELVRVPLLIRVADHPQRHDIDHRIGLIDLAPTLLDVLDVPAPASFRGRSRWLQMPTRGAWNHPVITECINGCTNPFYTQNRLAPRILAVRNATHKLVINFKSGRNEFFDLATDPTEEHALPANVCQQARRELLECARKHVVESRKARDFDSRLGVQLRDLGLEWAHSTANVPN
jgi:arylsulfatase A-like enzyme